MLSCDKDIKTIYGETSLMILTQYNPGALKY